MTFFLTFSASPNEKKNIPSAHAAAPTPLEEGVSGAQGGRKSAIISRGAEMFSCLDGCPLSVCSFCTSRHSSPPPVPPLAARQEVDGA